jgi:hypothetical protein
MALFEYGLACLEETLSSNEAVGWGQFCEVIHRHKDSLFIKGKSKNKRIKVEKCCFSSEKSNT